MPGPNNRASSGIQRGIQSRKQDLDRIDKHAVKLFKISGRLQVIGNGECSFDVTFPVTFGERPAFSFGYELAENQTPTAGSFPIVSVGVASWKTETTRIKGNFNYIGATLTAVANNNPHYLWIHWHMDGKAFQNPIRGLGEADPVV